MQKEDSEENSDMMEQRKEDEEQVEEHAPPKAETDFADEAFTAPQPKEEVEVDEDIPCAVEEESEEEDMLE